MNYVLDTDILIYFLKGHKKIVTQLTSRPLETIHTTIINQSELYFGAFNSMHKNKNLQIANNFLKNLNTLPFDASACLIFAEEKANLKKQGKMIADMDLMIASICMANQMTLVTNNGKHFDRIKALKMENWNA